MSAWQLAQAVPAAVKALSVLLKRHPGAALDMAAAAALRASRVGVHTVTERIAKFELEEKPRKNSRLSRAGTCDELRNLLSQPLQLVRLGAVSVQLVGCALDA